MTDQPTRRVAATRKVSLADFNENWTDCYVVLLLADLQEFRDSIAKDWTGALQAEVLDFELDTVKQHFVAGKIRIVGSDELVDMEPGDVTAVPELPDYLYSVIMGIDLDPKDLRKAARSTSVPSNSESTTKTPSSTE